MTDQETKDIEELEEKIKNTYVKTGTLTPEEIEAIKQRREKAIKSSSSAGIEFVAAILICTGFGIWLDRETDMAPLFMIIFMILGSVTAFYNLYKTSENLHSLPKESNFQLPSEEKDAKKTPTKK